MTSSRLIHCYFSATVKTFSLFQQSHPDVICYISRESKTTRNVLWSRASVCLSVRGRIPTLLHGPGCNLEEWQGCPLVVHYWADLQSVHGLRCYGNITRTRNVSEYMLVLALCLVDISVILSHLIIGHCRGCSTYVDHFKNFLIELDTDLRRLRVRKWPQSTTTSGAAQPSA